MCLKVDTSHDQKLKMKQIGELVANYFVWINKFAFLREGEHTLLSTFGINVHEV